MWVGTAREVPRPDRLRSRPQVGLDKCVTSEIATMIPCTRGSSHQTKGVPEYALVLDLTRVLADTHTTLIWRLSPYLARWRRRCSRGVFVIAGTDPSSVG